MAVYLLHVRWEKPGSPGFDPQPTELQVVGSETSGSGCTPATRALERPDELSGSGLCGELGCNNSKSPSYGMNLNELGKPGGGQCKPGTKRVMKAMLSVLVSSIKMAARSACCVFVDRVHHLPLQMKCSLAVPPGLLNRLCLFGGALKCTP